MNTSRSTSPKSSTLLTSTIQLRRWLMLDSQASDQKRASSTKEIPLERAILCPSQFVLSIAPLPFARRPSLLQHHLARIRHRAAKTQLVQ